MYRTDAEKDIGIMFFWLGVLFEKRTATLSSSNCACIYPSSTCNRVIMGLLWTRRIMTWHSLIIIQFVKTAATLITASICSLWCSRRYHFLSFYPQDIQEPVKSTYLGNKRMLNPHGKSTLVFLGCCSTTVVKVALFWAISLGDVSTCPTGVSCE